MAIGRLKRQADALAAEADRLRLERNAYARRTLGLLRERLASPTALAACFALGFLVGAPGRERRRSGQQRAGDDEAGAARALAAPLGAMAPIALRLATAWLASRQEIPGSAIGGFTDAAPPPPARV